MNDTEVDTIVTVVDKIKVELAKAGMDISVFGDTLDAEQIEKIAAGAGEARQLEIAMAQADLPLTQENLADCQDAMEQAADLAICNDEAVKYMLDNELPPTVENLYMVTRKKGSVHRSLLYARHSARIWLSLTNSSLLCEDGDIPFDLHTFFRLGYFC